MGTPQILDHCPRALRATTVLGAIVATVWFAALVVAVIDTTASLGQTPVDGTVAADPGFGLMIRTVAALGVALVLLGLRTLLDDWPRTSEVLLVVVSVTLVVAALAMRSYAEALVSPSTLLLVTVVVGLAMAGLAVTDLVRRASA